ncbi:AMP-binding protein [uncultured Megasphaera sp.]|uniref:AMP-binding protein n=1 Tax=uncultured Megasphaera sp. TaxID=165188 RepID=UPI00265A4613|nr:AMP-binding protein [uncultured Megasphaera sp.]
MYFFDRNPEFAAHTLFVDDQNHSISYSTWYNTAESLKDIIKPRSLAAIICHNTIGSALAYLSCLQCRIVPILIDHDMDADLQHQLIKRYSPAYIFRPVADNTHPPLYTMADYGLYRIAQDSPALYTELALLLTTSGSTGSPKLVRQSYENLQANAASIATYLDLTCADRPISTLPMHYTFGLSVINSHVLCGATEYLTEATVFEPSFWDFCKRSHITSIAGVPFTYECLNRLHIDTMPLPDLTLFIQAGGKLSKKLQEKYGRFAAETGRRFIVMYGQTEATARMSYLPAQDCLRKLGSIGIAIPGGTFHIMDDDHTELTVPGVVGELCYDGPNVTLGYAHAASDLCLGDERHGHLCTGDMAYRDSDGFYYITGRKKRFVKIMGKRVSLDEVEQLFKNAFADGEFACTGQDDDLRIFTTSSKSTDVLEQFLMNKTGLHPSCFSIIVVPAIPKNSSGKIQYTELFNSD